MSENDIGRLIYLALFGLGIGGWFFVQGRDSWGKTVQQALIWLFLFLGVIAAYGLWTDIERATLRQGMAQIGDGQIAVPRQEDGHYYLTLDVNGRSVLFVVDTGATDIVLTLADAERVGIDVSRLMFSGMANTANGTVRTASVRLETVTLGDVTDRDVHAVVNEGRMAQSLLGMGYLQRWGRIEIARDELILTR